MAINLTSAFADREDQAEPRFAMSTRCMFDVAHRLECVPRVSHIRDLVTYGPSCDHRVNIAWKLPLVSPLPYSLDAVPVGSREAMGHCEHSVREMKYSYNLVEAAALWAGIDPAAIQERIDANELKLAEQAHAQRAADALQENNEYRRKWKQQKLDCESCLDICPDWTTVTTEDGDVRRILNCPVGYREPLATVPPEVEAVISVPLARSRRITPTPGEFSDMPEFEERLSWLREAAATQDLPVALEKVRGSDLRAWISNHFPNQRPAFLFAEQADLEARLEQMTKERNDLAAEVIRLKKAQAADVSLKGKSLSSYSNLIGSFLALLALKHGYKGNDEMLRLALYDVFGGEGSQPHGLSKSFLTDVFAEAKRRMIEHDAYLKEAAFPKS